MNIEEQWEKEFEDKWYSLDGFMTHVMDESKDIELVKQFIQSLLDQQRQEIIELVESRRKDERFNGSDFYKEHKNVRWNEALNDIKEALNDTK